MRLEWGDEPLRFEFRLNRSTSAAEAHLLLALPPSDCSEPGRVWGRVEADRCDIVMSVITFVWDAAALRMCESGRQ